MNVVTDEDGSVALNSEAVAELPPVKPPIVTCTGCTLLDDEAPQEVSRSTNALVRRLRKVNNWLLYESGGYRNDIITLRAQLAEISEKYANLDRCYENNMRMVRDLSERIYELEFPLWSHHDDHKEMAALLIDKGLSFEEQLICCSVLYMNEVLSYEQDKVLRNAHNRVVGILMDECK